MLKASQALLFFSGCLKKLSWETLKSAIYFYECLHMHFYLTVIAWPNVHQIKCEQLNPFSEIYFKPLRELRVITNKWTKDSQNICALFWLIHLKV